MKQITVKLSIKERNYVDTLISQGKFASYGHSYRGLLYWHKIYVRQNEALRSENAALKEHLRLVLNGEIPKKA